MSAPFAGKLDSFNRLPEETGVTTKQWYITEAPESLEYANYAIG
jgi:hypothetical protein